jgi:hypothetical protein
MFCRKKRRTDISFNKYITRNMREGEKLKGKVCKKKSLVAVNLPSVCTYLIFILFWAVTVHDMFTVTAPWCNTPVTAPWCNTPVICDPSLFRGFWKNDISAWQLLWARGQLTDMQVLHTLHCTGTSWYRFW